MPPLPTGLDSKLKNIGELLGLLNSDGRVNPDWFSHAGSKLGDIPKRLPQLFNLIDGLLGPAIDGPPVFDGAQWYSIPDPLDGSATGFYLVIPQPSDNITSGT